MTVQSRYSTRNFAVASWLHYCLGADALIRVEKAQKDVSADSGFRFIFADEPQGSCKELADAFLSEESTIAGNARELLAANRQIGIAMQRCKAESRPWRWSS